MILCDTNILIEFYKGNEVITATLKTIGIPNLAVSVITAGELYFGARDKHELKKIKKHLALLKQLPLDIDSSALFLLLVEQFALSHKLSIPDGLIAATAIQNKLPLFTLNIKDFNFIPNLQLYKKQVEQT
jgi:tRNA(fMet)-specific endonuclease VapC